MGEKGLYNTWTTVAASSLQQQKNQQQYQPMLLLQISCYSSRNRIIRRVRISNSSKQQHYLNKANALSMPCHAMPSIYPLWARLPAAMPQLSLGGVEENDDYKLWRHKVRAHLTIIQLQLGRWPIKWFFSVSFFSLFSFIFCLETHLLPVSTKCGSNRSYKSSSSSRSSNKSCSNIGFAAARVRQSRIHG